MMQAGENIKNIVEGEPRKAAKVFRKKAEISSKLELTIRGAGTNN